MPSSPLNLVYHPEKAAGSRADTQQNENKFPARHKRVTPSLTAVRGLHFRAKCDNITLLLFADLHASPRTERFEVAASGRSFFMPTTGRGPTTCPPRTAALHREVRLDRSAVHM